MALFKSTEFKNADVDMSKREITGYAATWDLDQVGDVIHKGAFKKTISENLANIKVMYNHQRLFGKALEMYEDAKGLVTRSLVAETDLGEEMLTLAKGGFLTDMSIQFGIPQGKSERKDGVRHIKEIRLAEYGPVDFPANNAAKIIDVKSLRDQILSGAHFTLDEIDEMQEQLVEMKALLINEPPKGTQDRLQPHEIEALKNAIKSFGQ